jgi:hypothetical protein
MMRRIGIGALLIIKSGLRDHASDDNNHNGDPATSLRQE